MKTTSRISELLEKSPFGQIDELNDQQHREFEGWVEKIGPKGLERRGIVSSELQVTYGDAYRHTTTSARMASRFGTFVSGFLGLSKEVIDTAMRGQSLYDFVQDVYNNLAALSLDGDSADPIELELQVWSAFLEGKFVIISEDEKGEKKLEFSKGEHLTGSGHEIIKGPQSSLENRYLPETSALPDDMSGTDETATA